MKHGGFLALFLSLTRMVEALEKLDLTSEEKTAILSGNARRIFGAARKQN